MVSNERSSVNPGITPHPGEIISEYLEHHGWSQRDLARRTGLTPKTMSVICNGKASVTASTALALERVLQRPTHFWLNLQRQFDEAEIRRSDRIHSTEWKEWARGFSLQEMRQRKFTVPSATSDVDAVLRYFAVSSPERWRSVWNSCGANLRQTKEAQDDIPAISSWVRETEIVGTEIETNDFDRKLLRSLIKPMKQLTRKRVNEALAELQSLSARAGIALVVVPELPSTRIFGCARWLSTKKALIGLTQRYKTDDQLWFSFFHEMGHLLLHKSVRPFVIDNVKDDLLDTNVDVEMETCEVEANRFAADTLIPPNMLAEFVGRESFKSDAICEFADKVDVSPGIVVGRLQQSGILDHTQRIALNQSISSEF